MSINQYKIKKQQILFLESFPAVPRAPKAENLQQYQRNSADIIQS